MAAESVRATDRQTDRQLLYRFASQRDEAAFTALVKRHGPLVLGVCRRLLGNLEDAEDAFQNTFLVLARRAGSVQWHNSIANWLYGVAIRQALKVRKRLQKLSARGLANEPPDYRPSSDPARDVDSHDLHLVLHEEMKQLPGKYRAPLVLCYFEGKTHVEAARELGCPAGSMSLRVAHGLKLLRGRLAVRGLSFPGMLLPTLLTDRIVSATVPGSLTDSTIKAANDFAVPSTFLAVLAMANQALAWLVSAFAMVWRLISSLFATKVRAALASFLISAVIVGAVSYRATPLPLDQERVWTAELRRGIPVGSRPFLPASRPLPIPEITYSKQVARILQKNCHECHRPGQIGPFPLLTYTDVVTRADKIREVIQQGRMPPWDADPHYGKFSNERLLLKPERDDLLAWLDHGTPRGDDRDLPPLREAAPEWTIGKPDMIFSMEEKDAFEVPAVGPSNRIEYKYFYVDTHFTEDCWVERAEVKAGAAAVVRHMAVFIFQEGAGLSPELDKTRQGHGFSPELERASVLCCATPGDMPMILPPGVAKKIPAGSKLVFQMQYTPNGAVHKDRSSVGIIFARERPKRIAFGVPVATVNMWIPPGSDNYERESALTFRTEGFILSFMPHMRLHGKDFLAEAIYPDGRKETVLSVPRFNFNWQSIYRLEKPLPMPKGSRIHFIAHFDNSAKNSYNPDPTREVRWGDQPWEEKLTGWMDMMYELKEK
jgi:RNA polymerase sigma factor (sigma-70 family)